MVYDYFDKYTFICDMYDEEADSMLDLILNFYPSDNSVQVIDNKRAKVLLRRSQIPSLKIHALQIGNIVNIFSKLLRIVDCAPLTKRILFTNSESTFAMIKPIPADQLGKIITFIMKSGFRIVQMKNCKIHKEFAMDLYSYMGGSNVLPIIINYMTSGDVVGLELVRANAVSEWRRCLGSTDPKTAAPGTLRAMYGKSPLENCAHACESLERSKQFIETFFGYEKGVPRFPFRATFDNCSCCIIKPHVLLDGNVGAIIEQISISKKFFISALAMFSVNVNTALEFYEVYKGVVPEYESMAIQLAEGKCIVLEIKGIDPNMDVVTEFRKLCGPRDPDLCRQLYPDTIRALYGKSIVANAVHCTDLPEDGVDEVEYFFRLYTSQ